ncbi:hypothetical protein HK104_010465 [Borealophlyctis nickersoniae]|nr:hypothetical protein HK104_010465 [Borealophlyctis nickersoniae]
MQPPTSKRVKRRSARPRLNLLPWLAQTPSPIVPYELIRLIAQRSSPTTAAFVRCLDRTTARVILTADLVLIKAVDLCEDGLKYALESLAMALADSVQSRTDISEALYTTLVEWGADPEDDECEGASNLVAFAICFSHFNVVRAMVAAGVDVLRLFDRYRNATCEAGDEDWHDELTNPESFKFLVEELGYEPTPDLMRIALRTGQWENAAYLVSRGADPYAIEWDPIEEAIGGDFVETLEWLLQNRVDLRAEEMLAHRLEWRWAELGCPRSRGILGTVGFLLRKGADPLSIWNDKTLFERALEKELWAVAAMMLAEIGSSTGDNYQLLKSIATEDESLILPPGDPNAFKGAPLCLAASRNKIETIKLLLERGAFVTELSLRAAISNPENIAAFLLLLPVAETYTFKTISLFRFAHESGNIAAKRVLLEKLVGDCGGSVTWEDFVAGSH